MKSKEIERAFEELELAELKLLNEQGERDEYKMPEDLRKEIIGNILRIDAQRTEIASDRSKRIVEWTKALAGPILTAAVMLVIARTSLSFEVLTGNPGSFTSKLFLNQLARTQFGK